MKPGFQRSLGYAQDARSLSQVPLLKVKQDEGIAVTLGERENGALNSFVALAFLESVKRSQASGGSAHGIKAERRLAVSSDSRAAGVDSDRGDPGGEGGLAAEGGQ